MTTSAQDHSVAVSGDVGGDITVLHFEGNTPPSLDELARLLQSRIRITGDGNVVGDGSESTVIKQQGGDYAVQIGQLSMVLSPRALRELRRRYVPPDPPDPDSPIPDPGPLPPGSRILLTPNQHFTGREESLKTLARALLPSPPRAGERPGEGATLITQAIQGMGGVGKTQLAAAFAHRYGRYFHGVHWINAAQPEAIAGEIALCGQKMAAARETAFPQKLPDQLAWTLAAWQRGKARLIILDNLEEIDTARQWLGRLCGGSLRVLLTARRADWPGDLGLDPLPLDTFTPEESRAFLVKHLETRFPHARKGSPDPEAGGGDLAISLERELGEEEREMLDALAERLGHLPLALELAGRYIVSFDSPGFVGLSVADYLEELAEQRSSLEHESMQNWDQESGGPTKHDLDLMATFDLSWQRLEGKEDHVAQRIFLLAGYCAPNEPIPHDLLRRAGADEDDEPLSGKAYGRALNLLTGLGLLEQDADEPDTGPTIHPLLAEYARALPPFPSPNVGRGERAGERGEGLAALADTLATIAYEANMTGLPERFQPLRPHARAVAEWAEEAAADESAMEDAGTLWNNLGYHLKMVADYAGARASYERALRIDEAAYGPHHPNVAIRVNNLGTVQKAQGDLEGARASYERALGLWREAFGEEHPQVATALNNLGTVQKAQGDLEGARASFERALRIDEAAYGPDHPEVAIRVNNLGLVQKAQGDLEGARASYERALRIKEQVYESDHPSIATTVNNIGMVQKDQGDLEGARASLERALRIDEAAYGPDHPKVARDVNNLGLVQQDLGDLEGARASFERALRIDEAAYGPDHPEVAIDVNNLGEVLRQQGDLEGARASLERALRIDEAAFGPDHPKVAIRVNNLGLVQQAQGDLEGARASYERALRIDEAAFGPHHPNVARDVNNLGTVQQALGDLEGARASYERALRIKEQVYESDHPSIATTVNNIGMVQKAQGDLEGARASYERALGLWREAYGEEHPQVATALNNLGSVQQALGDLEGARASFERALRIDEAAYGPDHPNVARDVNNLGEVLRQQGDLEGARASLERALRIDEAAFGPHHPEVATDVNNLGLVQQDQGDLEGARASYERALRILENSQLPPDHPYIESLKQKLLVLQLQQMQEGSGDMEAEGMLEALMSLLNAETSE
jgi:tetratricopeptide (TPR) repeat protein